MEERISKLLYPCMGGAGSAPLPPHWEGTRGEAETRRMWFHLPYPKSALLVGSDPAVRAPRTRLPCGARSAGALMTPRSVEITTRWLYARQSDIVFALARAGSHFSWRR